MPNNDLYKQIGKVIRNHQSELAVPTGTTEGDIYTDVRDVMRNDPDIFWFSHQWKYVENKHLVQFFYTIPKDKSEKLKLQIKDVVDKDFRIDYVRTMTLENQLMYVYKWIILYCQYNLYSAYNQTICSVFVYRNSVCTGYAKAAQYLLQLLGFESRLVFGKVHNSAAGSRHCWLVVKVKGKWYHLDPTFANPDIKNLLVEAGVEPIMGADGLVYNYFFTDTETIKASRTIEDEDSLPICNTIIVADRLQDLKVKVAQREIGCLISDVGSTAKVYLYHGRDSQCVIKMFKTEHINSYHEALMARELSDCSHVLHYVGITGNSSGLIMEQATPLSDLLCCHYYKLTVRDFCNLLLDVLEGVQECLDRGIYYRDIHVNNIYRDNKGKYKLGDFGSCCHVGEKATNRGGVASEWYMSPETYKDGTFDEYSATYGVGMVAYFLLNNMYPPLWYKFGQSALHFRLHGYSLPLPIQLEKKNTKAEKMLCKILMKAISIEKRDRFSLATMTRMIVELRSIAQTDTSYIVEGGSSERFSPTTEPSIPFASTCMGNPNIFVSNGEVNSSYAQEKYCYNGCVPSPDCEYDFATTTLPFGNQKANMVDTYQPKIKTEPQVQAKKHSLFSRLFGKKRDNKEQVYSSVFAPSQAKRNSNMLVQVYLHLLKDKNTICELAKEADRDAIRREYIPLQTKLSHGDKVDLDFCVYSDKLVAHERKSVIWQGLFTKCSFRYFVPANFKIDNINCEINLYVNGALIGEMSFTTDLVDYPRNLNAEIKAKTFEKIFISYAHQDSEQVKKFALAYKAQGVNYFFDRDKLGGGDIYEEKIFDFIDRADLFLLCWSKNAERSEYVTKELCRAMSHAYPQKSREEATLKIYPISIEPHAPYPSVIQKIYNVIEI